MKILQKSIITFLFFTTIATKAMAAAEYYKIDNNHNNIVWKISHFGFSSPSGKILEAEGGFFLDEKNPEKSSVSIVMQMNSISSGIAKFDNHLKNEDFFDVKNFPTAKFVSKKIEFKASRMAKINGDLTIKGITKNITLNARLNKIGISPITQKKTAGFSVSTSFNRSDFGINFGLPNIANLVKIDIEIEGILSPESAPVKENDDKNKANNSDIRQWFIINQKSLIEFNALQNKSKISGNFKKFDGKIFFDPLQLPRSSILINVNTDSIDLNFSEAMETIKNSQWLDIAKFPKAKFVSKSISALGNNKFMAIGDMIIKGTTKEVSFPFTVDKTGSNQIFAQGNLIINRSDFDVGTNDGKKSNNDEDIKQSVKIIFKISAEGDNIKPESSNNTSNLESFRANPVQAY